MQVLNRPWGAMHYRIDGPADGPPVVFANSLGTDLRLWDALLAEMPGIRAVRFDKRGHGLSDEGGDFSIDDLADDAAALIEHLALGPVVFVGLSIGGMIAQALAARRPDLVRAAVLSNTAVRMGTTQSWGDRIAAVETGGIDAIADTIMERWFAPAFRATPVLAAWRNMVARTSVPGYVGACRALATTDLSLTTRLLDLPVLVIAGDQDGSSPSDLVLATAELIPGATFHIVRDAGHLPCVEQPAAFAAILKPFLQEHAR
ncbi:3-oxoadipate enol-lactonase [Paracoccus laeviglucosivorans]|uniref:3-oxoadipate enol-lactonase n=1 Tax=Paracoccus laeviglucosivorans TaxID=1197861 RepID=A0A521B3Y8_9RHOB|nr:3-oxoadipate enol-lactonase [Paracoccus laeviglucosivorans]SMO41783.1 3-oxoadipate enol-lactonase [Paracoccus laeviglucosivorans]